MKIVYVNPNEKPYELEINKELEQYQQLVGGYIECVYPYDDNAVMVCNDEGKLDRLPLNRGIYDGTGRLIDVIAGSFFIVGDDGEGDFCSLTDEQIKKYLAMYDEIEEYADDEPLSAPTMFFVSFADLGLDDYEERYEDLLD